ncbi:PAS domain-containing protein [Bacteriovorax sp. DB6_IX]|uniref:PAS domain-containing protein n=1 Tax=Bacteriovorax sp. DB6_IX TaxID=1353530 RepID=UPI00038A1527|nr:PAS domain-containing protein [Bacteriovorax sp. DB6_IX]EQC52208.1 PAS domain S-box protein [Bacteriovorax sp. DB6_IX]
MWIEVKTLIDLWSKSRRMNFEELFLTSIETLPMPCFYKDRKLRYQGCNNIFAIEILGLGKKEIEGKTMQELAGSIPDDLAKKYIMQDERLFESLGRQVYESDVKCADGERRKFRFVKKAIVSSSGEVQGIFGVMIDLNAELKSSSLLSHHKHYEALGKKSAYLAHEINGQLMRMKAILKKGKGLTDSLQNSELSRLSDELIKTHENLASIRVGYAVSVMKNFKASKVN